MDFVGTAHVFATAVHDSPKPVGTTYVFDIAVDDPPLRSPNRVYEAVDRAELCEKGR